MREKGHSSEGSDDDKKIIAYQFDGRRLFSSDDKYLFVDANDFERKLGSVPGRILWILVEAAFDRPGQLVEKERLLDFVPSKEALRMNICRLKKDYVPDKILTKRNEGYRLDATTVAPIYEGDVVLPWLKQPPEKPAPALHSEDSQAAPAENLASALVPFPPGHGPAPFRTDDLPVRAANKIIPTYSILAAGVIVTLLLGLLYLGREYRHKTRDIGERETLLQQQGNQIVYLTKQLNALNVPGEVKSTNEILIASQISIGLWLRDAKPYRVELEKEYNALQLTILVEGAQKNFYVEMTEATASKSPIVQHRVKKDSHDTVSVTIPKDRLKNGSYRLKVYPAAAKSLAREYSVQVHIQQ